MALPVQSNAKTEMRPRAESCCAVLAFFLKVVASSQISPLLRCKVNNFPPNFQIKNHLKADMVMWRKISTSPFFVPGKY